MKLLYLKIYMKENFYDSFIQLVKYKYFFYLNSLYIVDITLEKDYQYIFVECLLCFFFQKYEVILLFNW